MKQFLIALTILFTTCMGVAEDRLADIFQDNMVLQRGKPVPVWGWGNPQTKVSVTFAGQTKEVAADAQGYWKVTLDPLEANRQGQVLEAKIGGATVGCKNVLVGEVWIAAGQSNMVHAGPDDDTGLYPRQVSVPGKPEIRVRPFGWGASLEPLSDIDPAGRDGKSWETLKENPAEKTMGPANYFARVLRDGLDVPVGIIRIAVPGTNQAAWMSRETLEAFPGQGGQNFYQSFLASNEEKLSNSKGPIKSFADFKAVETAWRKSKDGRWPGTGLVYYNFPTSLYNTRVVPLAPFAVRGVIWHQGEAGPGGPYGDRLVAMTKQWRTLFGQDFDFIWGTLGRSTASATPMSPMRGSFYRSINNRSIRDAIKGFGDDKHVAMVELYDLGNEETHFLQKAEAGRRYANAALTLSYDKPVAFSGPRLIDSKIDGNKAILRFDLVGDGIAYQPSIDGISGVYLRSKKGVARWGDVKIIDKNSIEVSHPDIDAIETLAYGEHPNPHETLLNSAKLPASPFAINLTNTRDEAPAYQLIEVEGAGKDVQMQVAHVRREGYVFQLKPDAKASPGPVTVQAYISSEWKGFEVESKGKPVTFTEKTVDGKKFVTFKADVDLAWIIIAEKGQAEGMRKINRY